MKPALLLDVDGVLNVPSRRGDPGWRTYRRRNHRDEVHTLTVHPMHTLWLRELAQVYDLVWCTTWWPVANDSLRDLWQLEALPAVPLPADLSGAPVSLCAKTPHVREWAQGRTMAWIDDDVTEVDGEHLGDALTLNVDPAVGVTREHVDRLLEWVRLRPGQDFS